MKKEMESKTTVKIRAEINLKIKRVGLPGKPLAYKIMI